jgi:hypothetical protein
MGEEGNMLGIEELKRQIEVTATTVECPVKGCTESVERQHHHYRTDPKFMCPKHCIYISPSTFEYENHKDNLLWKDNSDLDLLKRIKEGKRESRMARDNSEDAVTWNVFRYLEKNRLLEAFLSQLTGKRQENAEAIYWSYSQKEGSSWGCIDRARREFGEARNRNSEPDMIIQTDSAIFFIEAKLTTGNKTKPSNEKNSKKYETGGNCWFREVFLSDYETIAITEKKYELMRFWLLGTWMAEQSGREFYLINLVRVGREQDIESVFGKHIRKSPRIKFSRLTWESIYRYILDQNRAKNRDAMLRYFRNKTIGYRNGALQKAFSI